MDLLTTVIVTLLGLIEVISVKVYNNSTEICLYPNKTLLVFTSEEKLLDFDIYKKKRRKIYLQALRITFEESLFTTNGINHNR